jgi:hypothetical protein
MKVVDVGETGSDVVRWWPAGPVRGPSVPFCVPFCGRYDAFGTDQWVHGQYVTLSQ